MVKSKKLIQIIILLIFLLMLFLQTGCQRLEINIETTVDSEGGIVPSPRDRAVPEFQMNEIKVDDFAPNTYVEEIEVISDGECNEVFDSDWVESNEYIVEFEDNEELTIMRKVCIKKNSGSGTGKNIGEYEVVPDTYIKDVQILADECEDGWVLMSTMKIKIDVVSSALFNLEKTHTEETLYLCSLYNGESGSASGDIDKNSISEFEINKGTVLKRIKFDENACSGEWGQVGFTKGVWNIDYDGPVPSDVADYRAQYESDIYICGDYNDDDVSDGTDLLNFVENGAILFENVDYGGNFRIIDEDIDDLEDFENKASSVKIKDTQITLYDEKNYRGAPSFVDNNIANLGEFNDKASSIKVGESVECIEVTDATTGIISGSPDDFCGRLDSGRVCNSDPLGCDGGILDCSGFFNILTFGLSRSRYTCESDIPRSSDGSFTFECCLEKDLDAYQDGVGCYNDGISFYDVQPTRDQIENVRDQCYEGCGETFEGSSRDECKQGVDDQIPERCVDYTDFDPRNEAIQGFSLNDYCLENTEKDFCSLGGVADRCTIDGDGGTFDCREIEDNFCDYIFRGDEEVKLNFKCCVDSPVNPADVAISCVDVGKARGYGDEDISSMCNIRCASVLGDEGAFECADIVNLELEGYSCPVQETISLNELRNTHSTGNNYCSSVDPELECKTLKCEPGSVDPNCVLGIFDCDYDFSNEQGDLNLEIECCTEGDCRGFGQACVESVSSEFGFSYDEVKSQCENNYCQDVCPQDVDACISGVNDILVPGTIVVPQPLVGLCQLAAEEQEIPTITCLGCCNELLTDSFGDQIGTCCPVGECQMRPTQKVSGITGIGDVILEYTNLDFNNDDTFDFIIWVDLIDYGEVTTGIPVEGFRSLLEEDKIEFNYLGQSYDFFAPQGVDCSFFAGGQGVSGIPAPSINCREATVKSFNGIVASCQQNEFVNGIFIKDVTEQKGSGDLNDIVVTCCPVRNAVSCPDNKCI